MNTHTMANDDKSKKKIKKYVLTGGTSVGKTTVIELLSKQGYTTFPEFSRVLINEELEKEKSGHPNPILPWTNPAVFQDIYAKRQVVEENQIDTYISDNKERRGSSTDNQDSIFIDRCIIDGIAFCQHAKVTIPREIDDHVKKLRTDGQDYDLIFILEPLGQYHFDEGRVMKPEESLAVQGLIADAYLSYGYSLISVPFMSPEERVKFILEKAREHTSPSTNG